MSKIHSGNTKSVSRRGKIPLILGISLLLLIVSAPNTSGACEQLGSKWGAKGYAINLESGEGGPDNNFGNFRGEGCTYTFDYWKTHGDPLNPKKYDATWDLVGGSGAPFLDSGYSYMQVLETAPKAGNAWYILAHQYIAAYLNYLNGADPTVLLSPENVMEKAFALLDAYDGNDGIGGNEPIIPKSDPIRNEAIRLDGILDDFNNGLIGPGPCDY